MVNLFPSKPTRVSQPVSRQRMAERIGNAEERNTEARDDPAIQLVHRVAIQQNTIGGALLQLGRLIPKKVFDRSLITAPHSRLELGKIDASYQDFSRMKAA